VSGIDTWTFTFYKLIWNGLDLLFPPNCAGCGKPGFRWCGDCQSQIIPIPTPICDICGTPQNKSGLCNICQSSRPPYHALRSWSVFEGPIRRAIHKIKYRRDMGLGEALANPVADFLQNQNWNIDMVIPIPLSSQRYKERGYNQIALVAYPLAVIMDLVYSPNALVRCKNTRSQVGLSASERMKNVEGAFEGKCKLISGKSVLLMDDVATTGSTLYSAAEALKTSGAVKVYTLTLARALAHHGYNII
jgi:ComF family protein